MFQGSSFDRLNRNTSNAFADPAAERPTFDMTPPPAQYGLSAAVAAASPCVPDVQVTSLLSPPLVPATKVGGDVEGEYVMDSKSGESPAGVTVQSVDAAFETPEQRKRRLNTERSRKYRERKREKSQMEELAARHDDADSTLTE